MKAKRFSSETRITKGGQTFDEGTSSSDAKARAKSSIDVIREIEVLCDRCLQMISTKRIESEMVREEEIKGLERILKVEVEDLAGRVQVSF